MFKVTIWYKIPVSGISIEPQALIPDSIAATFSSKLSQRGLLEEQTSYTNPDVVVFSNIGDCNNPSLIVGLKAIFKSNLTDLAVIYAIVRHEFARTMNQFRVVESENNIVLAITPSSLTYNTHGSWQAEQSETLNPSWQARLETPPVNLTTNPSQDTGLFLNPIEAGQAFASRNCGNYMLMNRSNRLPGLDQSHRINTDTGLSPDMQRGGTIDPNNNPNPGYSSGNQPPQNQNTGLGFPVVPVVGGVLVVGLLVAVYLYQTGKDKNTKTTP